MRNAFSPSWSKFIRESRLAKDWTRKELAFAANCDASLITLIERDGHIPMRTTVEKLGNAIGDQEAAIAAAGLLDKPTDLKRGQRQWLELQGRLPVEAINALELLSRVSKARQNEGLNVLSAYASSELKRKTGKRVHNA